MAEEKIRAEQICVDELFSYKYLFQVPDYQRPFVWEEANFEQLFEDIKNEIDRNKESQEVKDRIMDYEPYFLGSIVLHTRKSKDDGSGQYDIVDGRQRLVSLTILISVLRDLADSVGNSVARDTLKEKIQQEENVYRGTKESVRIEVKENEKDFFKKYILTLSGTLELSRLDKSKIKRLRQELNESGNRMFDAVEVFQRSFQDSKGQINRNLLDEYITYLLQKVVVVTVKTSTFASAFRLFKTLNKRGIGLDNADLLKNESLSVIPEEKRQKYAQYWEDLEEESKTGKLDDLIAFIRIIKLPRRQQFEIFQEFESKIFKEEPIFKGEQFIDYLIEVREIYSKKVRNGLLLLERDTQQKHIVYYHNLISIMRDFLVFKEWMATIIFFDKKYQNDIDLFNFLINLERRTFLDWATGFTQEKRVARVFEIIKIIELETDPKKVVNHPIFFDDMQQRKNDLENILNESIYLKSSGKLARYILLRINMERSDNRNQLTSYSGDISVEHILPNEPNISYWLEKFSEDTRIEWTNKIGNLTLLDGRKNSKSGNKSFPDKKVYYFERNRNSSFELTNELQKYEDWNINTLMERQEKLKGEAISLWFKRL